MPDGHGTGERGPRWVAVSLAIVVLVVLVVVIGSATDRDEQVAAPTTIARPLPSTSSEADPTTTTLGVEFRNLSGVVPGVRGTLHALVGEEDHRLYEIPSDPDETLEVARIDLVASFGFDVSGRLLGFLEEGQARFGLDRLNVWSETAMFTFGDLGATTNAWHETEPRSMAAITVDATGRTVLRTLRFEDDNLAAEVDTVIDVDGGQSLVAWGEFGFLFTRYDPPSDSDVTTLLDQEGDVIWRRHDLTVLDASSDEFLAQLGRSGEHVLVDPDDPDAVRSLLSLPDGGTVTGSDFSSDGRLAVHFPLEGHDWNLRVYATGFETFTDFVLEGWRVWDLEWSTDGRFIVMPGTDDGGGHVVIFYDTSLNEMYLFYFNTWVQWAELSQALRG